MIDSITQHILNEMKNLDVLYHGSYTQNLKKISPKNSGEGSLVKYPSRVYASNDKRFASIWCIPWSFLKTEGIKCKDPRNYRTCENWKVFITHFSKWWFDRPCSVYAVTSPTRWIRPKYKGDKALKLLEYYTESTVTVIKEVKYRSIKECYIKNNIKFEYKGITADHKGIYYAPDFSNLADDAFDIE
jgi:hypothetical protein